MLVSVLSENLSKKISFLNHAISSRAQLPILSNFLIEAKDNKLILSATDLEIGIIVSFAANVEKEGSAVIPARNFLDLVTNIGNKKITLELVDGVVKLKGDRVKASFPTVPAEDFPKIYESKGDHFLKLSKKDIETFFLRTAFSVSIDSSRVSLTGLLFETQKEGLVLVSTDQYRLSMQKTPLTAKEELEKPIIVPGRVIKEVMSMKDEGEVDFYISKDSNQIVVSQEDVVLVGRIIDEDFPPYGKIIPAELATKTEFNREELLNAVKICSVFARETANVVKLSLEKDKIIVSANTPAAGEDSVEVDAKITGEANEIAFNAKYLIDVLSVLVEDDLTFEMNGPLNSGVFRIVKDASYLHLIMPIKVQE